MLHREAFLFIFFKFRASAFGCSAQTRMLDSNRQGKDWMHPTF
jgi:hypothetical protein